MSVLLVNGNALTIPLESGSVHCVVTSPPYWSLRDYGIPGQLGLESTPDCGRPFMKLRSDLTEKEYQLVLSRLEELGLI